MNNTIDFKTAKTIDSMSKKLDHIDDTVTGFFSVMHMAMKHELGSAEPYFAATSPVLDLTVIRPDDAPHILACCLAQAGCRLFQHGQDVHIHRDTRRMGCGVKRNRIVHRRYLQIFANKKDPIGSYVTVSARCGAAAFSATHPKAG